MSFTSLRRREERERREEESGRVLSFDY